MGFVSQGKTMNNTLNYNIQPRETKKGKVYDVFFYVVTPDGRKHKRLCGYKTKTLAKKAYTDFMATFLSAPIKYDGKSQVRFEDAFRAYLGAIQYNVKESTMYEITHIFKLHISQHFKNKNIEDITKTDILSFLDYQWGKTHNGKPYSQKSLMKIYGFFKTFYNWCVTHYNIPNALNGVKPPKRRDNKEPRLIWTAHEFERFVACIDSLKYKAIFTTLFYCGCRIGELQAMTPRDYDGKQLFIHATLSPKTLDGSAYKVTETKNYKSRYVPLPEKATVIIDEWIVYKNEHGLSNVFLFGGDTPSSLNAIRFSFEKGIRLSNVKRIRIHDLRHSYVSLLMAKGVNFGVIAALIGDTLEQVVKTYAHHVEDDKKKAVALL